MNNTCPALSMSKAISEGEAGTPARADRSRSVAQWSAERRAVDGVDTPLSERRSDAGTPVRSVQEMAVMAAANVANAKIGAGSGKKRRVVIRGVERMIRTC
jgi:hypothetical protein